MFHGTLVGKGCSDNGRYVGVHTFLFIFFTEVIALKFAASGNTNYFTFPVWYSLVP